MKLHPSDPSFLPDLLAFLREHGCIAYTREGAGEIVAMVPELPGGEETRVIRGLVQRWRSAHPTVEVDLTEP